MARAGQRMVDVELVTGPSPDEPDARSNEHTGAAIPWWVRRWRPLATAAVLLIAASVAGWSLTTEAAAVRLDDALVDAYADVAGIAPTLRDPLTPRWQAAAPGGLAGGLVLTREDTAGGPRTVARDVATGRTHWTAPASVDPAGRGLRCPATVLQATLLLCDVPGEPGYGGPTTDAVLGGTPDRLVTLRAADGQVVAQRELGTTTIGWAVLDDDVVMASRNGGTAYLELSAPIGDRVGWRAEMRLPPDVLARELQVVTSDGFVVLTGPVAAVLDARDGAVLGQWESSRGRFPVQVVTSAIGFAVWTSPSNGIWYDRAGRAGSHLPGAPVRTGVDDGSDPRIVLLQDPQLLRAVDVYAGTLWEQPRVHRAAVRVDGILLLEDSRGLRAVDLRSGQERWTMASASASIADRSAVTDGVRFLVEEGTATGRLITAYDLRDGTRRWSAPFPARATEVSVGAGLLVREDDELTVFGGVDLGP